MENIQIFVSLLIAIGGFFIGNLTAYKHDVKAEGSEMEVIKQDIKHIKENVDELINDKRESALTLHALDKRISELEIYQNEYKKALDEISEKLSLLTDRM